MASYIIYFNRRRENNNFTSLTDTTTMKQKAEKHINPLTNFGFKKLFEIAEIARFTEKERQEYEESLKTYRDIKNIVDTAKAEGRAEGKTEEKTEVIERCLEEKMSPEMISKIVNLSIPEVKRIIDVINRRNDTQ